jgi:hypothetical protein
MAYQTLKQKDKDGQIKKKKLRLQKKKNGKIHHSPWSEKSEIGLCRGAGELDISECLERRRP